MHKSTKKSVNQSDGHGMGMGASRMAGGANASRRCHPASVAMWILNAGLVTAAWFALTNWTTVNWLTGSYGWAALLEISALLLLLYLFLSGTCLFGFKSRVDRSFLHLGDSPQILSLFALAIPFLIVSFFGVLAGLSLTNLRHTNVFIASHAESVFYQARSAGLASANFAGIPWDTPEERLSRQDFIAHICSLPPFECPWMECVPADSLNANGTAAADGSSSSSTSSSSSSGSTSTSSSSDLKVCRDLDPLPPGTDTDFKSVLSGIFDSMLESSGHTDYASIGDVYHGVMVALEPYRQRLGWSCVGIALVCILQFMYFWIRLKQEQKKTGGSKGMKGSVTESIPFIGP